MTNLDREELRNRLKTVHESQGIRKSVAMKLMQELDETEAKWRKEWGKVNSVLTLHALYYRNPSDEVYRNNPMCVECKVPYPCNTRVLIQGPNYDRPY